MAKRKKECATVYLLKETKDFVDERADDEGVSFTVYVAGIIKQHKNKYEKLQADKMKLNAEKLNA